MNNWTIAGRLGQDAVTRHTKDGKSVTGFSVAVDQRHGGEKTTLWVDCSLWGEPGEKVAPYLTKGTTVSVSGVASAREHGGKAYMGLFVRELTLLGGGHSDRPNQPQARAAQGSQRDMPADMTDDDIPF